MPRNSHNLFLIHAYLFLLVPVATTMAQATFQGLDDLPGGNYSSMAYGVSGDGSVVVGQSYSSSGLEAFRWTQADGIKGLGDLPGGSFSSTARGVAANGLTIVGWSVGEDGTEAYRRFDGLDMVGLGEVPGGTFHSQAMDLSPGGVVVVGSGSSDLPWVNAVVPFRWTEVGGMVGLGLPTGAISGGANGVSDNGLVIVGTWNRSGSGFEAFRWTEAGGAVGLDDLYAANDGWSVYSYANDISADGTFIVGLAITGETTIEAYRWSGGMMVGLGDLPGGAHESQAYAVSDDGSVIVGYGRTRPGAFEAFVWTTEQNMRGVKDVLVNDYGLDLTGWSLEQATAVSADGRTIVGYGTGPSGREGWVAHLGDIPQPGDCDGNGSVDPADFTCFHPCLTAPSPSGLDAACAILDSDSDDDVDLSDVAVFFNLLSESP